MSAEIREFADKVLVKLEAAIERLDINRSNNSSEKLNALDAQIRDEAWKLEDLLESHVSNQFLSQSESLGGEFHESSFFLDLHEINEDIDSFTESMKKFKEEYIKELSNLLPGKDDHVVSSRTDHIVENRSKMVGLSDQVRIIEGMLTSLSRRFFVVYSLVGMAGIGKTTLAKEVYEDPSVLIHFECRAWVTVGPKYQLKEILQCIIAQANPGIRKLLTEGDERMADLERTMSENLKGRRYLIVLDDVWNSNVCTDLKRLLPDDDNGSRVLLTTRLRGVARSASRSDVHETRFMNEKESWDLLREKVFGDDSCPPQLEKIGKKIAENCDGLPLTIITVADLLFKAEKSIEYWNKATEKQSPIFMDAYDQMTKVLLPSYKYLPQHLKACFLYMGVFPPNYVIPRSKLIKLWSVEGFLEPEQFRTIEDLCIECLNELTSRSLVMIHQESSGSFFGETTYTIKTCKLHSSFWHLCNREAGKNKFSHVINSYADSLAEGMKSQRRLCVHNNVLFGIKDAYNSMASISTTRSLLCTGPYHQYPVPICFDLMLLKILDALTIRFYEFPNEILKLLQLKYLALNFNGQLPPSISKLRKLQCLIVRRNLTLKSAGCPSSLPLEIWDMKKLKHLQIIGSNLQDPCDGVLLDGLLTLLDVSAHSCTKSVFRRIPNLEKLGIRIELAPNVVESFRCFDHISNLKKLVSLKCVIVNPIFGSEVVAPPPPLSIFSSSLTKLSLSGFGYPWEEMSTISSLRNLEVLKLRCYAFRGPKWEVEDYGFRRLGFLLIEDTDLVHWAVGDDSFRLLKCLSLKHCYKLEEIPQEFGESLTRIEVVDCSLSAVTWAKQIKEHRMESVYGFGDVFVHSTL
ncbi:hypothetical protein DH2020_024888 [Rehmannia glutinosa]|uniref:NB-ARC domain-containing protein n=1 Tax=Rehmannia glutinosa TaxID=99300 RepID=A0ABR0W3X3_REHGL